MPKAPGCRRRRPKAGGWPLFAIAVALSAPGSHPVFAKDLVIHAGRMIDGVSAKVRGPSSILIRDDRIVAVSEGFTTPGDASVVDLRGMTVLPGLIDCHVHLLIRKDGRPPMLQAVTQTPYDNLMDGVVDASLTLRAGFTSVRDAGGHTGAVLALKRAIEKGAVEGPRMWVSGHILGPTGGHSDERTGYDPELSRPEWEEGLIDGADSAIRTVRAMHRDGVNLVKITVSGGITSVGTDPGAQLMSEEEIGAVVRTAHALRMKVAAHVFGAEAIAHAARLGVDSIEHGSYADKAAYAAMRDNGVYLVPTMTAGDTGVKIAREHPELFAPSSARKMLAIGPVMQKNLHDAYKAGVRIAFGTDAGMYPHGQNRREFALMVAAGMTPMDTIMAATGEAAKLIGAENDIGSLQPGRLADIVAVRGDPAADVAALDDVTFIMKGGAVVVGAGAAEQGSAR